MRGKNAILNIASNLILQLVVVLYGLIIPKIIISNYGSNVNGLLSSITQFLTYIALLESGLGPVVKASLYEPIAKKNQKKIVNILNATEKFFRKLAYIFLLYVIVLCLIYPILVNKEFSWIFTSSLILIISISTFAEYFFGMTYRLYLQAEQKTYIVTIIQIITYILSTIIIILLAMMGFNIHIIKIGSGLVFVLRPILQNHYVKKHFNINIEKADNNYKLKQKWDGLAQHIASVIHINTDVTVLTIFSNLVNVSIYSVYALVVAGVKKIVNSFSSGIEATFGDMIAKKEIDNLNNKFSMYEVLYNSLSTIVFSCAIILIIPFVKVYTKNITDANYINPLFGILLVISEYIWAIRLPYSTITLAAGHFKETRIGAWVECITNISLSIILVWKYGLIGVAIGTIIAMTIRTIEFIYHTNKYILERNIINSVKKVTLVIIETLIIIFLCNYLPYLDNINYTNWIINAIPVLCTSSFITLLFNFVFFKKEVKAVVEFFKKTFRRKSK